MSIAPFPWEHYVDEESKTVYVHIPGGYPTTLALPILIERHFPNYKGSIASLSFIQTIKKNNQ